jgi:hypothetical protein
LVEVEYLGTVDRDLSPVGLNEVTRPDTTAGFNAGTSTKCFDSPLRSSPKLRPEARADDEGVALIAVGALSVGWSVFFGVDHLYDFATGVYSARTADDLERASEHQGGLDIGDPSAQ